jgi:hypothetical protein
MLIAGLMGLLGLVALLSARGYRHRLQVVAGTPACSLAEALDGGHDAPVAIRARAARHGSRQQAPVSGRPCIWWALRARSHKRATNLMLQDIGVPVEKTSPHPFLLTDGAREVRVEPDRLVSYGHPHSLHVSEKHRHWDHPPPLRQQVVRSVPELARFLEPGVRRVDYTEWLIEEGAEVTITGRLVVDQETGEAILSAFTTPGQPHPIFKMTPGTDHTDVEDLRRKYRRSIAVGLALLIGGGGCLLGVAASIVPELW